MRPVNDFKERLNEMTEDACQAHSRLPATVRLKILRIETTEFSRYGNAAERN
jgi:hypothetical protein